MVATFAVVSAIQFFASKELLISAYDPDMARALGKAEAAGGPIDPRFRRAVEVKAAWYRGEATDAELDEQRRIVRGLAGTVGPQCWASWGPANGQASRCAGQILRVERELWGLSRDEQRSRVDAMRARLG